LSAMAWACVVAKETTSISTDKVLLVPTKQNRRIFVPPNFSLLMLPIKRQDFPLINEGIAPNIPVFQDFRIV